jgi:hypothetical protein
MSRMSPLVLFFIKVSYKVFWSLRSILGEEDYDVD